MSHNCEAHQPHASGQHAMIAKPTVRLFFSGDKDIYRIPTGLLSNCNEPPELPMPLALFCRCGRVPRTSPTSSCLAPGTTSPACCGSTVTWCPGTASG